MAGRRIRVLDLGVVPPLRSQACYHAAAYAMNEYTPDTIILVSPASPYVCIGFHQDAVKEVDLEYCRDRGLLVSRREVGGGAVYLDAGQLFVQWVFHPASLPESIEDKFRCFIKPMVQTYRSLGINAVQRPVNDIHVAGKKIGGTGAAAVGRAEVAVGSFMFDFDRAAMARVLRVPSEKMRDKIHRSLESYMTTMKDELGAVPERTEVKNLYLRAASECLQAEMIPGEWTEREEWEARRLEELFRSPEWLFQKGSLRREAVRIHEGVEVSEADYKTPGGLLRATLRRRDGLIDGLWLSGDFTLEPRAAVEAVERRLVGLPAERAAIVAAVEEVYRRMMIRSPGLEPADWAAAVLKAAGLEP